MSNVYEITDGPEHDAFINDNDKCMIFFGSAGCSHCRTMIPIYNKFVKKYPSVKFSHVEITKVTTKNIQGVPAFVGYKAHEPVDLVLGANPEAVEMMIVAKLM